MSNNTIKDIKQIAVIGGGNMGRGIAMVFAMANYPVNLYSRRAETLQDAMKGIELDLEFLVEKKIVKTSQIKKTLENIYCTQDLAESVNNTDFVVESIVEDMALKQNIFKELDQICPPEVILATNTSVMSPTEIASKSKYKERILATHWWNPPFLIPLVEVVQTKDTAPWVINLTIQLHKKIGKHPVHAHKDAPGFIANRLQHALWREAISIVEHGIADAQTVNESLKYGPALRWPIVAPLENSDMVGLDLTLAIHEYVLKYLEDSHKPSPLLKEKVQRGELGFKTGGVGFQKWSQKEQKDLRNNMLDYLADSVLRLKERDR